MQAIITLHLLTRIFLRANSTLSARPVMETWLLFSPLREDERLESGKWMWHFVSLCTVVRGSGRGGGGGEGGRREGVGGAWEGEGGERE